MPTTNKEREIRIAQRRVEGFAQQFGEAHRNLARHAAFPLVLTPDLLYQIWANFVPEAPWTAVAHVLLSRLCRQVGYEMYEMDIADRNLLLRELKGEFGQERFDELGEFLLDYVAQRLTDDEADTRDLREAQEWTVLAYTKPGELAHQMMQKLAERVQQDDIGEILRLASLVETWTEPLMEEGFEPLLVYSRGVDSLVRSSQSSNIFSVLKLKKILAPNVVNSTLLQKILDSANLGLPKGLLDSTNFAIKGILDSTNLGLPKGLLDSTNFAIKGILDSTNLGLPKGLLDSTNFAPVRSIELDVQRQRYPLISKTSDSQFKHELISKLINLIHDDATLIDSAIESELNEKLSGEKVTSYLIPDDSNEGTIDEVGEIKEINLNTENLKSYENYFTISFSLKVDCQITYFIYKADYYAMDDDENSISIVDDDWNDHYFHAEQYYLLNVEGIVSVHPTFENINHPNISEDEAYEILENAQTSIDSFNKIEILENI
jgi:hypothetical protein